MDREKPGCLAFIFGFGSSKAIENKTANSGTGMNEGDVHSGPGGYEGMGYSGGYASDYLADEDNAHG